MVEARLEPAEALAFLRELLAEGGAEPGRLIRVTGAVASGKSGLLDDLADLAGREGVRALSATGAADERMLAFGIVDQLLSGPALPRAVAEEAEQTIEAFRDRVLGGRVDELELTRAAAHVIRRLAQVLLNLARRQPVVIAVDDADLADGASVLLLRQLQRRIRRARLTIVLTARERPGPGRGRGDLALRPHHHIRLAPLSESSVRGLLADLLGDRVGGTLPFLVHRLGAGIPMLVNALLDDYVTTGRLGEDAPAGTAYSRALVSYLGRSELPLREAAGAMAVFGAATSTEVIAALLGIAHDVAEEVTEALTGSGLLVGDGFRHAVTGSAALAGLTPGERASAHLRAAELKLQRAAPAKDVAVHLIAAGSGEPRWAVPVLRKAADEAVAADEVDFARQCLELALASAATDADRRSILGSLTRCVWRVSPAASAAHAGALLELPWDGRTPVTGAETVAVARQVLWQGDEAEYRRRWRAAEGRLDERAETGLRLACEWWFGPVGAGSPGPASEDGPWRRTAAALSRIWWESGNGASTAAAQRILRGLPLGDDSLEALMTALLALVYAGRTDDARMHWRALKTEADQRGAVTWQAVLTGMWSGVILRGGDVPYAVELARHALSLLPAEDWGAAIGGPLATLVLAHTAAGEFDRAAGVLARHVPDGVHRTVAGVRYVRARGQYHLATGRLLAAVGDFEECRELLAALGGDLPVIAPWRADLAAANLGLGNLGTAAGLAAEQLGLAAETDAYTRGLALRVLAFAGDRATLRATLRQAVEEFEESGDRWEAGRTSRMLERSQPGPIPGPAPARPVAGSPPSLRTVTEAMSAAEARVAQLAATGLTNQQISSSLCITVSTVEQHLTRVYRKLGIRSRSLLAAKLADE